MAGTPRRGKTRELAIKPPCLTPTSLRRRWAQGVHRPILFGSVKVSGPADINRCTALPGRPAVRPRRSRGAPASGRAAAAQLQTTRSGEEAGGEDMARRSNRTNDVDSRQRRHFLSAVGIPTCGAPGVFGGADGGSFAHGLNERMRVREGTLPAQARGIRGSREGGRRCNAPARFRSPLWPRPASRICGR
jgi:hypothetical protein